jgi:hypothetical protein
MPVPTIIAEPVSFVCVGVTKNFDRKKHNAKTQRTISMRPMNTGHRGTTTTTTFWRPYLLLYYLLLVGNDDDVMIRRAEAYPDYLLTRSNCWTALSTGEVIMNFPVVSVAQSDDPQMRIMEIADEKAKKNNPKIVLVGVRTTNIKTNKDYQYVLDVIEGECTIEGGGCDNNRRIGGRAKDIVKVILPNEEGAVCTLQAGWAANHEAVRLTPLLDIGAVPEDEDEEEEEEEAGAEVEEETIDTSTGDQRNEKYKEEEIIIHDATLEDPSEHSRPEKKRPVDQTDHHQHHQHISYDTVKRKHYEKNLLQYEIGFDHLGLSWTGYVRGAMFLLVAPSLAVCLCLQLSQCSNKQKRRDL